MLSCLWDPLIPLPPALSLQSPHSWCNGHTDDHRCNTENKTTRCISSQKRSSQFSTVTHNRYTTACSGQRKSLPPYLPSIWMHLEPIALSASENIGDSLHNCTRTLQRPTNSPRISQISLINRSQGLWFEAAGFWKAVRICVSRRWTASPQRGPDLVAYLIGNMNQTCHQKPSKNIEWHEIKSNENNKLDQT